MTAHRTPLTQASSCDIHLINSIRSMFHAFASLHFLGLLRPDTLNAAPANIPPPIPPPPPTLRPAPAAAPPPPGLLLLSPTPSLPVMPSPAVLRCMPKLPPPLLRDAEEPAGAAEGGGLVRPSAGRLCRPGPFRELATLAAGRCMPAIAETQGASKERPKQVKEGGDKASEMCVWSGA